MSKKIGSAPQRNRVKRLIREVFRLHQADLHLKADLVVIPKKGVRPESLSYRQVERELIGLMNRVAQEQARHPGEGRPVKQPK